MLDSERPIRGLDDSKALSAERRSLLAHRIRDRARAWAVAAMDAFAVDRMNIYQASRLALRRAIETLSIQPDFVFVDGPLTLDVPMAQRSLIRGDARCASIAAASIVAKVARDEALQAWAKVYPEFGLDANKGYGAPAHLAALQASGTTPHHRFSFEPVRQAAGLGQACLFPETA